jgi:hypothetical protein
MVLILINWLVFVQRNNRKGKERKGAHLGTVLVFSLSSPEGGAGVRRPMVFPVQIPSPQPFP